MGRTLVQFVAVPKPDVSLSAVVVSGGKQYRVAPGDRILVDRLSAEPGSSLKLGRVLLLADGSDVKVGSALEGLEVDARVIDHRRGPRIETIRYKSKKRVRVHRGGRAHLTALEIIAVGGVDLETAEKEEVKEEKPKTKGRPKAAPRAGRARAASAEKKAEAKAEVAEEKAEEPKKPARRRTRKETE
jgi:large subunit ribosomal protein L21